MVEITLKIDGMSCGMCETHINDTIRRNFQVNKVKSSHSKGETVIIAEESLDQDQLKSAIAETGYEVLDIKEVPYEKKGFFSFLHK
jgi:copper chaperone CopZ